MDFIVTILYLWLTLFLQCGAPMEHRISKRLVGGDEVSSIKEFPYIAYIWRDNLFPSFCAGAIISDHWVLSVANCLIPRDPITVVKVGQITQHSSHPVSKIIAHPKFEVTSAHLKNNIAVLYVKKSLFCCNPNIRVIALGSIPDESGIRVKTAGWGYTDDSSGSYAKRIQKLSLQTVDSEHCRKIHNKVGNVVGPTEICASGGLGKATCEGDEGNPLVTIDKNLLVGIHSGYQSCKGDFPGLYTRISYFILWLRRVTKIRFHAIRY